MAAGWGEAETNALIEVWGAADVQNQLDAVSRNRHIYQRISRDLQQLGYTNLAAMQDQDKKFDTKVQKG